MAKSLIVSYSNSTGFVDAATYFAPIGSILVSFTSALEARLEAPIRDAGTFRNLFVFVVSNTASVSSTVTLRKSQADTAVTLTITSDATGIFEDTSNSVAFAATDEGDFEITVPSEVGTNTLTLSVIGVEFDPTTSTDTVSFMRAVTGAGGSGITINLASDTAFASPVGNLSGFDVTENNTKYRIRSACVAQDLYTFVSSNARTTDTVFSTRKSGGSGSQSVTYTSGQTGAKEDTSNTDTLAAGDDFNYQQVTGTGTGNLVMQGISCTLVSTNNTFHMLAARTAFTVSAVFNSNLFIGVNGTNASTTTEANSQIYPRFSFLAKEMGMYVSANTIATSPSTITLRDNGANSSVAVSYNAGQTGLKNDSTNTTVITSATDEISYNIVTPNTSGSLTYCWISVLGDTSPIATITGTIVPSVTEADIVTGGKTIIITLTLDTWVASGATFDAQRQNIINGIDSAQSEGTGWDAVVKAGLAVTDVVRTSDTVVTITLPAFASYNITSNETITATIPSTALTSGVALVGSPTFQVTAVASSVLKDIIGAGVVPFPR